MNKLALLLVAVALGAGAPAGAVAVFLSPSVAIAGNPFDVDVKVSGLGAGSAPSIGAFDVTLDFDPLAVAFQASTVSSDLGGPLQKLDGLIPAAASVRVFATSLLSPGALDALQGADVTLATLTFDALAPGATTIDFASVLLGDGFGVRITPNTVTGSTLPVIPEPGAVLLFGLGAAIVGARIWRGRSR